MRILIAKERTPFETRVAATPETVKHYIGKGATVVVESGAGDSAYIPDRFFVEAGAEIVPVSREEWAKADIVFKVSKLETLPDGTKESEAMREGAIFASLLSPFSEDDTIRQLKDKKISAISMEFIPRTTRAQRMDALSSQANIAGYKAVLEMATELPKYFPLLMTAAGTVKPARVIIMGAGVAGLQAIATARRLGAVVEASDIRPVVQEQIESLGAKFIPLPKTEESGEGQGGYAKSVSEDYLRQQREILTEHLVHADVVITTAQIPGRPAPRLLTEEMIAAMKPGAVILDMAVESGGNSAHSKLGETVNINGVRIFGPRNLPATLPADASMLYSRNLQALFGEFLTKEGALQLDTENDVVGPALVTHNGQIVHEATRNRLEGAQG